MRSKRFLKPFIKTLRRNSKIKLFKTMREENVLSKLDNPYIVKYFESFMNEDSLCIITEFCHVS